MSALAQRSEQMAGISQGESVLFAKVERTGLLQTMVNICIKNALDACPRSEVRTIKDDLIVQSQASRYLNRIVSLFMDLPNCAPNSGRICAWPTGGLISIVL